MTPTSNDRTLTKFSSNSSSFPFSLFIFIPSSSRRVMSEAIIRVSRAGVPFIHISGSLLRDTRSRWAFWFGCLAKSVRTGRDCHLAVMMIKGAPWNASVLPLLFHPSETSLLATFPAPFFKRPISEMFAASQHKMTIIYLLEDVFQHH